MTRLAYLNQDPGIAPGAMKGAAVHVAAMRAAFEQAGAQLVAIDEPDSQRASSALEAAHAVAPIDLVFERYALGARAGARFCRTRAVALVLEVNAPLLDEASVHRGRGPGALDFACEREVFEAASCILTVSNQVAGYVNSRGIDPRKLRVRPNAVDTQRFAPLVDRGAARRALGLESSFVLGFHGRLRPWHGFERIAAVTARMRQCGIPAHVLTLGAGDFASALRACLPAAAFTTLPWVAHEQVGRTVGCFDALALAYSPQSPCYFSPLKLLEAMACGVVPVVPSLGDLPEIVHDGHDGLVYAAHEDDGMFRALAALAADPSLRERLAAQAARSAAGRSWIAIAKEVLSLVARPAASA